jgi:hypothetical protein
MRQRLYNFRALVAVLAALTLSVPAIAGEQVPFKGGSSGVSTVVGFDPVAAIVYVHFVGTGQATHLGNFTATGDVAIHEIEGIVLGIYTLTAANGDMIFLTMSGHGIDPFHASGAFTVVGGTGRFQGATGSYQEIITFLVLPGTSATVPYTDVLEGTISFGRQ